MRLEINGIGHELVEEQEIEAKMMNHMDIYFEMHFTNFLKNKYDMSIADLDEIIKKEFS